MKNITSFSNFKKLNEEADPGVLADEKTYFANVKGNFAGAETTLIGSNVIRLFRFLRRKGSQGILNTVHKKLLYAEYLKGLLRYVIRYDAHLPNVNKEFEATYHKNINEEEVEKVEMVVIINPIKVDEKKYEQFVINNDVIRKDGEKLEDGFYIIQKLNIKIINGKIIEILDIIDIKDDKKEDIKKEENKEIEIIEDDDIEDHVKEFIKDIKDKYEKLDNKNNFSFYNKYSPRIKKLKRIFEENIKEIEKIKSTNPNAISLKLVTIDLKVFNKTVEKLQELDEYIKKDAEQSQKEDIDQVNKKPENIENVEKEKQVAENFNYSNYNKIYEKSPSVELNKELKKVKPSKIADDLNLLSQTDIDLEDPEFVKQFNNEEKRKEVTKVVLESRPEIVKIQLSAERHYIGTSGVDRKLENDWLKMVENVKSKFNRFMITESVDPINLKKKMGDVDLGKLNDPKNEIPILRNADTIKDYNDLSENTKLKDTLIFGKKFKDQNPGSFGIVEINSDYFIYCLDTVSIPYGSKDVHKTYKIIGKLKNDFISKAKKDKNKKDFSDFVDRNDLTNLFIPNKKTKVENSINFYYKDTFIISQSTEHLSTGTKNTSCFILYVYSKGNSNEITESNISDFLFVYIDKKGEYKNLKNSYPTDANDKIIDQNKISISVSEPWLIKNTEISVFGLISEDAKLNLNQLTKNPQQYGGGYSLGEFKKYTIKK